jgi:hypothetical protein
MTFVRPGADSENSDKFRKMENWSQTTPDKWSIYSTQIVTYFGIVVESKLIANFIQQFIYNDTAAT